MTILAAAHEYVDAGISICPTLPGGQKKPAVAWKPYTTQKAAHDQIDTWYGQHPEWGIAAISGEVSGNLLMVELEGRAAHHLATLKDLAETKGLGDLWQHVTGGWFEMSPTGGLHWHLRSTAPVPGNQKLARTQNREVLAETRGEGGYTIVAPTDGSHHTSGQPWRRLAGGPHTVAVLSADEVDAFLNLFRTLDEESEPEPPRPLTLAPTLPSGRLRPGDDYNQNADWADILTGWQPHHREGATQYWTRPGKDRRDGASATTGHAGTGHEDRLYVFSTSTEFPTETPISKFHAYAIVHHGGNDQEAARTLAQQGWGERLEDIPINLPTAPTRPQLHVIDGNNALQPQPEPEPAPLIQVRHSGDLNEAANGKYLVDAYGDQIRYVTDRDRWLHWDGHVWQTCGKGAAPIKQLAITALSALPVATKEEAKFRTRSLNSAGISNTLTLAATDPRAAITQTQLDAYPDELNTPEGIVNLKTGKLGPSDSSHLHTRSTLTSPNPHQPTPKWDKFLSDTFAGHDPQLITYTQQLAGYTATGYVTSQVLPFFYGAGANGKSVLAEVIMRILHDYAQPAPANFLMLTQTQHPTEIARLQGARLVIASEVPEGAKFDETKVKQLTGGDTLTARYMHGDYFVFQPTHKLWLLGNHQPKVPAGGHSFWRRLRQIPFTNIVDADKRISNLTEQLVEEEGAGILQWIISGAISFLSHGLQEPPEVLEATKAYEASEDHLQRFVDDRLHIGGGAPVRVTYKEMRGAYTAWCRLEGISPTTANAFTREAQGRFDIGVTKSNGARYYTNCTLLADADSPDLDLTNPWADLGGGR